MMEARDARRDATNTRALAWFPARHTAWLCHVLVVGLVPTGTAIGVLMGVLCPPGAGC